MDGIASHYKNDMWIILDHQRFLGTAQKLWKMEVIKQRKHAVVSLWRMDVYWPQDALQVNRTHRINSIQFGWRLFLQGLHRTGEGGGVIWWHCPLPDGNLLQNYSLKCTRASKGDREWHGCIHLAYHAVQQGQSVGKIKWPFDAAFTYLQSIFRMT